MIIVTGGHYTPEGRTELKALRLVSANVSIKTLELTDLTEAPAGYHLAFTHPDKEHPWQIWTDEETRDRLLVIYGLGVFRLNWVNQENAAEKAALRYLRDAGVLTVTVNGEEVDFG